MVSRFLLFPLLPLLSSFYGFPCFLSVLPTFLSVLPLSSGCLSLVLPFFFLPLFYLPATSLSSPSIPSYLCHLSSLFSRLPLFTASPFPFILLDFRNPALFSTETSKTLRRNSLLFLFMEEIGRFLYLKVILAVWKNIPLLR